MTTTKDSLEILTWKIDWLTLRAPIKGVSIDSELIKKICTDLQLELNKETSRLYRDNTKKIAIKIFDEAIEIQFEGQFFSDNRSFLKAKEYYQFLNVDTQKTIKKSLWKISRADIAVDVLDVTPIQVLPDPSDKYVYSFSAQHIPIAHTKYNPESPTTIYFKNRQWQIRAYRKDIEQKDKASDKKGFYDLSQTNLKDRAITRLEVELRQTETEHINALLTYEDLDEETIVKSCFAAFSERKTLRVRPDNNDTNLSRWPIYWSFQLIRSESIDVPPERFIKAPTNFDNIIRFGKAYKSVAKKEQMSDKEIISLLQEILKAS